MVVLIRVLIGPLSLLGRCRVLDRLVIALVREVQFVQEVARLRRDLSELREMQAGLSPASPHEIETVAIPEKEIRCAEEPNVRPGARCRRLEEGVVGKDKNV